MDNCNYKLTSSFTRFGGNDTTNCQLKIDKDTFNRYEDTLTQKQIYSNIANRNVRNFSVCIPDISNVGTKVINVTVTNGKPPPPQGGILTSPPTRNKPPDNNMIFIHSSKATTLVSEEHPDQIPEEVVENSYPSCSYKPIKF
jgi:hypothetical protein